MKKQLFRIILRKKYYCMRFCLVIIKLFILIYFHSIEIVKKLMIKVTLLKFEAICFGRDSNVCQSRWQFGPFLGA